MEFHPLANVLPLMEGEPFAELVADIKANGLREPIMVYEDKVLDGRNRFRACVDLGMQPDLEYFNGGDPVAFVISKNIHRRHLDTSQRAMVAAKLATMKRGDPASQRHDGQICPSHSEAAALLNVSPRSVKAAKRILNEGRPDEIAAVENGEKRIARVTQTIDARKRYADTQTVAGKSVTPNPAGARLVAPEDGLTIEQWCRRGLAIEAAGSSIEDAAQQIAFNVTSYRQAREIILLSDRDDLPARDAEICRQALADLNSTRRLRVNHDAVNHIVIRMWGDGRYPRNQATVEKRAEHFQHMVGICWQAAESSRELQVPHLNQETASDCIRQLEQARTHLAAMISKLKDIYQ